MIGAPYEDNMKGALYVYNGGASALNPTPSQRVTKEGVLTFGSSLAAIDSLSHCGYPGM